MFYIGTFNHRNYPTLFDLLLPELPNLLPNPGCSIKGKAKDPIKIVSGHCSESMAKQ